MAYVCVCLCACVCARDEAVRSAFFRISLSASVRFPLFAMLPLTWLRPSLRAAVPVVLGVHGRNCIIESAGEGARNETSSPK